MQELVKVYKTQIINVKQLILIENLELSEKPIDKGMPPSFDSRMIEHNSQLILTHESELAKQKDTFSAKIISLESKISLLNHSNTNLLFNQDLRQTLLSSIGMKD